MYTVLVGTKKSVNSQAQKLMNNTIKISIGIICFVLSLISIMTISNDLLAYMSTSLLLALSISLFGDATDKR